MTSWGDVNEARQKLKGTWELTLTIRCKPHGDDDEYQGTAVAEGGQSISELLNRAKKDVSAQLMGRIAPAMEEFEKKRNEPKEDVKVMKECFAWDTRVVDEEQLQTIVAGWREILTNGLDLWLCIDTEGCVKMPEYDTRCARVLVLGVGNKAVLAVANEASWRVLLPLIRDSRCKIVMHDAEADKARLSFLVRGGPELDHVLCTQNLNRSLDVSRHDGLVPLAGELLCGNRALTEKKESGQRWYDAFDQVVDYSSLAELSLHHIEYAAADVIAT